MSSPRRFLVVHVALTCLLMVLIHQVVGGGVMVDVDRAAANLARRVAPSRDILLVLDKLALRGLILVVCIPLLVWLSRKERTWIPLWGFLLVLVFQTGITGSLKVAIGRTFPYQGDMLLDTDSLAFPSGHATNAMALWGFVLWWVSDARREYRRAAVMALGSILVIAGATSWLLRTHWLTDLVAGYVIGCIALGTVVAMLCALGLNPASCGAGVGGPSARGLSRAARSPLRPAVRHETSDAR